MTAKSLPVVAVIAVLALLTGGTIGGAEAADTKHEELQRQISAVQTSVNNVNAKATTIDGKVDGLQSQLDTLQSQLDDHATPWTQALPAAERFVEVLGGAAILDKETGLVWEQSPSPFPRSWDTAHHICNNIKVGNRLGWGLPTVQELMSLIDPANPDGDPDLPPGHPFTGVQSAGYWSGTPDASVANNAWIVSVASGSTASQPKSFVLHVWCVRGGHGG